MKTPALFRLSRSLMNYKRRSEVVQSMPVRLWVETSAMCNLECIMCPNKELPSDKLSIMDLDLFEKIVDEARGFAQDIYLHHRGEPFINPQLFSMIRYAEEAGLRTRFHSNGTMLTSGRAAKLLEAEPSMISFSVDGFSKEPYERIRQGASFEKTIGNIVFLAKQKRSYRLKKPYIIVERIKFKKPDPAENEESIAAMKKYLLENGVNEVIEKDEYEWATDQASGGASVDKQACCTFPWYAMVICADGTVTPCPQDYWGKMVMGNARTSSLREIWNDNPYRNLRRAFRGNIDSLPLCRTCDRLCRETVAGVPLQYAKSFLVDQLVGYGKVRKLLGSSERS